MPPSEKPWGLGQLLNSIFGKEVMTPGPTSVSAGGTLQSVPVHTQLANSLFGHGNAPSEPTGGIFAKYGMLPPDPADQGPLSALFPDGATPMRQDLLPPWATKGLDAAGPLLLLSGLVAANSFGTGQPQAFPSRPGGTMNFARPSDALAKLMMAQQRQRGR